MVDLAAVAATAAGISAWSEGVNGCPLLLVKEVRPATAPIVRQWLVTAFMAGRAFQILAHTLDVSEYLWPVVRDVSCPTGWLRRTDVDGPVTTWMFTPPLASDELSG